MVDAMLLCPSIAFTVAEDTGALLHLIMLLSQLTFENQTHGMALTLKGLVLAYAGIMDQYFASYW